MAEKLIISISGMRGIIGENLTPAVAAEYGCAFGSYLKMAGSAEGKKLSVCIGTDSRPSGQMLCSSVAAGLCSVGIDVISLGIVPTPSVGVMLKKLGCNGGIIITASHNPIAYNGIKLLTGDAVAPPPESSGKITEIFHKKEFDFAASVDCGKVTFCGDTDETHIAKVLGLVDRDLIGSKGFKVVLDSVNGAGGPITMKLFELLGCDVKGVNTEPTGIFAHTPEPTRENLSGFGKEVLEFGGNIGFAQDPDADRLVIIDENGEYIGEEYTLALAGLYAFSKKQGAKAAVNLSTSRMIDDVAKRYGATVIRTCVGEANVAKAILENDCVIGGEGNGGIIDLRVGPIRDSLVGIALILQLLAESGKTVSQLVSEIGGYCMIKEKFAADKDLADRIMNRAVEIFEGAAVDNRDGYRFDFDDGWVHLRTSNTEPVMRVMAEAREEEAARKYIDTVMDIKDSL